MAICCDRRQVLKQTAGLLLGGSCRDGLWTLAAAQPADGKGVVVGQREGAKVGGLVLAAGGNAVDAAVAAALVSGVVALPACGIGGYGGHLVIALPKGKKVTAIDFNSTAPAAAKEDMFPLARATVTGKVNEHGWLAAGVPGTLAGMQLALDRYGTLPFGKVVEPAIRLARDGFEVSAGLANAIQAARAQLLKDPGSTRLLLDKGEPPKPGSTFRNPGLATMLQTLADRKSVASFYEGDIGQRIAREFQKHGGLVTAEDMAAYRAREVEPLELTWRGYSIRTAPLTAGGITVLEALAFLKAMSGENLRGNDSQTRRAQLEALRLAWDDRLKLLGDPAKVDVPTSRLLSQDHAKQMAARIEKALRSGKPVEATTDGGKEDGTIHLNAIDGQGMMVALTLTHGGTFGAQVAVDGLGLILGQGMSRFDPRPGRPNSPGPGKRPLHNMCPTIVLRDGQPLLALGGTGGRKIPNAVFHVLTHYVGRDASLVEAVAAPRCHTEGDLNVLVEAQWPEADLASLKEVGYAVVTGSSAVVQAAAFDHKTTASRTAAR